MIVNDGNYQSICHFRLETEVRKLCDLWDINLLPLFMSKKKYMYHRIINEYSMEITHLQTLATFNCILMVFRVGFQIFSNDM